MVRVPCLPATCQFEMCAQPVACSIALLNLSQSRILPRLWRHNQSHPRSCASQSQHLERGRVCV
jgi:hypothetical protein